MLIVDKEGNRREATPEEEAAFQASIPAPAPPPVPEEISDRQFFQQLANMELITRAEALAAVTTGTLPAALVEFVEQLPEEDQFAANMLLAGAGSFLRSNPLVETFGAMQGMTSDDIDQLWRDAFVL